MQLTISTVILARMCQPKERSDMVKVQELEKWWTPRQVQSYTGFSRQGILEFAKEGKIRAAFVGLAHKEHGRGMWIYDPVSVEEFVERRGTKSKNVEEHRSRRNEIEVVAEDRAGYGDQS